MKTPEQALVLANLAPPHTDALAGYRPAIEVLREKGWTYRDIALWLKVECHCECDHNSVWRCVAKGIL